jgi:hypothetical protein
MFKPAWKGRGRYDALRPGRQPDPSGRPALVKAGQVRHRSCRSPPGLQAGRWPLIVPVCELFRAARSLGSGTTWQQLRIRCLRNGRSDGSGYSHFDLVIAGVDMLAGDGIGSQLSTGLIR